MTNALDQSILELLHASRDDEETIHLPVNDRSFGFHVQQAVEKLLKALIAANGKRFEFTHDIQSLVKELVALHEQLPVATAPLEALTQFAGIWRYQEPAKLTAEEKVSLKANVETLRAHVIARLLNLRPSYDWSSES